MNFEDEYRYQYIRLDKLCKDYLASDKGITTYIEYLDKIGKHKYQDDYTRLKKYRRIRNEMAHENDPDEIYTCDYSDIDWLINFHQRILEQSDPLALERKKVHVMSESKIKSDDLSIENHQVKTGRINIFILLVIVILFILLTVCFI